VRTVERDISRSERNGELTIEAWVQWEGESLLPRHTVECRGLLREVWSERGESG